MYVDSSTAHAQLHDAEDTSRLAIHAPEDFPIDRIDRSLRTSGLGQVQDGSAHLSITALREAAMRDGASAEAFEAMIQYARRMKWASTEGLYVKAHIEYTPAHQGEQP